MPVTSFIVGFIELEYVTAKVIFSCLFHHLQSIRMSHEYVNDSLVLVASDS
jgi:hypothetical protein